jgi:RNA-dependent RNA polymerase
VGITYGYYAVHFRLALSASNSGIHGCRPHPNECSGSDLDGDIYFVSWDQTLIPSRMVEPMDYTQQPAETLDHDVTIKVVSNLKPFIFNAVVANS